VLLFRVLRDPCFRKRNFNNTGIFLRVIV
jgi:integrase